MTRNNATQTALRIVLLSAFLFFSCVLLRFTFGGPFQLILPVQSPVNPEALIGISFLLLVLLRSVPAQTAPDYLAAPLWICLAAIIAITIPPFLSTLSDPLLHDSYAHVVRASHESFRQILALLNHPSGPDLFFRPLGYLSFWLDFKWAAFDSFRWHLWSLTVHVVNTLLTFVLAKELGLSRFSACIASLTFGIHASRPEVVVWTAARFDLLACFFVLCSLLAVMRYVRTNDARWYAPMLICALLAVLSKESAYCLPFLIIAFIPFSAPGARDRLLRAALAAFALCGAVFAYRSWVVTGLGGYQTGTSLLLHFNPVHLIKALFFRQWAMLFFPIDWARSLSIWTKTSVIVAVLVMIAAALLSKTPNRLLAAAIILLLVAEIPVQHLLLMSSDLAGARVLYLPSLGLALFWGLLLQDCRGAPVQLVLAAGLVIFQLTALAHNSGAWRETAVLAQSVCRATASQLTREDTPVWVQGLPATWKGVFFLQNGFPECVALNAHTPLPPIHTEREPPSGIYRIFIWNNKMQRIEPKE